MTYQDRALLTAALISGTSLLLVLSGLGWVVVQLLNLIRPTKIGA